MTMARRPSPFGELLSLRQAMDRLFEDSYVRSRGVAYGSVEALALPLDIYSTPTAIVVEAALPGVRPKDVEITVLGNTLTISGTSFEERNSEEPDFMYQELRRGTFARTVALPSNLDTHNSTATFEHGMLRLSIPKAAEAKPRQIRITPTHDSSATERAAAGNGDGGNAGTDAGTDDSRAGEAPNNESWDAGTAEVSDSAEAWGEPAAASGDTWSGLQSAADTWGQTPAAGDTWGQPATGDADGWGASAAAQDPYAATADTAQEWQAADAEAGSWQAPDADQWEDPTAQPRATGAGGEAPQDQSTSWTPQQVSEGLGDRQRDGDQARG